MHNVSTTKKLSIPNCNKRPTSCLFCMSRSERVFVGFGLLIAFYNDFSFYRIENWQKFISVVLNRFRESWIANTSPFYFSSNLIVKNLVCYL